MVGSSNRHSIKLITVLVIATEMLDNRQMTAQYTGQNPTAMQILNMHSTNLLPTVSDLDTSGAGEV